MPIRTIEKQTSVGFDHNALKGGDLVERAMETDYSSGHEILTVARSLWDARREPYAPITRVWRFDAKSGNFTCIYSSDKDTTLEKPRTSALTRNYQIPRRNVFSGHILHRLAVWLETVRRWERRDTL